MRMRRDAMRVHGHVTILTNSRDASPVGASTEQGLHPSTVNSLKLSPPPLIGDARETVRLNCKSVNHSTDYRPEIQ